jgi:hypothetical protein
VTTGISFNNVPVKNITISVDDDLWFKIRDAAAAQHKSMNSFIGETIARSLSGADLTAGERATRIAIQLGPAPCSWKWKRSELYEEGPS